MITKVIKYISYDDDRGTFRLVLKTRHIGYYISLEEATRVRNIECVKRGLAVPTDGPKVEVPTSTTAEKALTPKITLV